MSQSKQTLFGLPRADLDHVVRLAERDFRILRGSQILLTGGTGFFGKWLLASLHHAEREIGLEVAVTIVSRDPNRFISQHPELSALARLLSLVFVKADVARFGITGYRPDYIIHAATDTTAFTGEADERERARAIVAGTQRVIELARVAGTKRLLNISSGAVYGAFAAQPGGAREDNYTRAAATTPYGRAKREAETICADSGVDFVTARAFAFLGPLLPLDAHFAAGNFLRDAVRGGPIIVRGDGTALRSYLHPADLVVWLLRLLIRGRRARAYNVGSDESVTTAQLARAIAGATPSRPEVVIQSAQPRGPQNIYLPNITRARDELALDIAIPLRDAIARTMSSLKTRYPA